MLGFIINLERRELVHLRYRSFFFKKRCLKESVSRNVMTHRNRKNTSIIKIFGEFFCVQCCTTNDQFQIITESYNIFDKPKKDVRVQSPLMSLINYKNKNQKGGVLERNLAYV